MRLRMAGPAGPGPLAAMKACSGVHHWARRGLTVTSNGPRARGKSIMRPGLTGSLLRMVRLQPRWRLLGYSYRPRIRQAASSKPNPIIHSHGAAVPRAIIPN